MIEAINQSNILIPILAGALRAGTPLVFAATGELIYERSGVMNLGLEGLMLVGAMSGIWAHLQWNSLLISLLFAFLSGALAGLFHAFLCVRLRTHQIATGLAFVIFFSGLTAFLGDGLVGKPIVVSSPHPPLWLSRLPVVGPIFFQQDVLVYIAIIFAIFAWFFLYKTRIGIMLRATGDSARSASSTGIPVVKIRLMAGTICGGLCGLGGVHLSLLYASQWQENMVAGRGWIALAIVILSMWKPFPLLLGAYLFGGLTALQLNLQAHGVQSSQYLLGAVPFIITIILFVAASLLVRRQPTRMPRDLGSTYYPE